jgi:glucokinase
MNTFAVGVDVGGTYIRAGVVDERGNIRTLRQQRLPVSADQIQAVLTATVREAIESAESEGLVGLDSQGRVTAIGVGAAGLVDVGAGVVRFAPNIGYRNFELRKILQAEFELPVTTDNDATAAAYGEYRIGCEPFGIRHMVLVTLGTGIGGGLVLDGRLYRGNKGFAGEIGHILVDKNGLACGCGQRGCWETIASGTALGEMGRQAAREGRAYRILQLAGGDLTKLKGEHVVAAAKEGDDVALQLMSEYAERVAIGLAVLANVLDPEVFVIGGGVSEAADLFLPRTAEAFALRLQGRPYREPIPVEAAKLGSNAGVIGAALIALASTQSGDGSA